MKVSCEWSSGLVLIPYTNKIRTMFASMSTCTVCAQFGADMCTSASLMMSRSVQAIVWHFDPTYLRG